jgi:hypothetical protein
MTDSSSTSQSGSPRDVVNKHGAMTGNLKLFITHTTPTGMGLDDLAEAGSFTKEVLQSVAQPDSVGSAHVISAVSQVQSIQGIAQNAFNVA